jgi:antitoxin component of MazEF toxin-antitoxin module
VYAVPNEIAARVNFSTDYAFDLEVGTEQMAARPYARPSAAENKDAIERVIADQIAATLGGGT